MKLKGQIPEWKENEELHREWCNANHKEWAEELRDVILQYRSLGRRWNFSESQKKILGLYYDAHLLLLRGINTSNIDPSVKSKIMENLLLPMDEVYKKK